MKFGSQKAFFARIWDRLHCNDPHVDGKKRKFNQPKKPKSKSPAPMQNSATDNLMNMQFGGGNLGRPPSYLDTANAFSNLGGLSTAGLLNGYGVGGMLQGNNGFNPSAQFDGGDMGATKRRKI